MNSLIIEPIQYNDFITIENIGSQCLPIYYKLYDLLQLEKSSKYILLKAILSKPKQVGLLQSVALGPVIGSERIIINNSNTNTIVGFIIAEKKKKVVEEYLHIMSIAVLEKYRNYSIGTKLLHAIKQKTNIITLYVQTCNYIASKFYEKNGFIQTKLISNYYETLDCKDAYMYTYSK